MNKDLPAGWPPNREGFSSPSFLGPNNDEEPFPKRGFDCPVPPNRGLADVVFPKSPPPVLFENIDLL